MDRKHVSVIILSLLVVSALALAYNFRIVKSGFWQQTIYIKADGSISPPTAPISTADNVTYTFTDNIKNASDNAIWIQRDNAIVDGAGYTLEGGVQASGSGAIGIGSLASNVTIKNVTITAFYIGIFLNSSGNSVKGNDIIANSGDGIHSVSSNNNISENDVSNNGVGISLFWMSSNNRIVGNNVSNNDVGISLSSGSPNNMIVGNTISNNAWGISLNSSSNIIYNNNFFGPMIHNVVCYYGSTNVWDNGYPSGGNYWSGFLEVDNKWGSNQDKAGSDGIGDIKYVAFDSNNVDNYPLMGNFSTAVGNAAASIPCISNSTVSDFQISGRTINFSVSGQHGTGFCTVTILDSILPHNYKIEIDGMPPQSQNVIYQDATQTVIYFTYPLSTHEVTITGGLGGGGGRMPYLR